MTLGEAERILAETLDALIEGGLYDEVEDILKKNRGAFSLSEEYFEKIRILKQEKQE
jgi:hypothetical protein